jgi:hypothetical protein
MPVTAEILATEMALLTAGPTAAADTTGTSQMPTAYLQQQACNNRDASNSRATSNPMKFGIFTKKIIFQSKKV